MRSDNDQRYNLRVATLTLLLFALVAVVIHFSGCPKVNADTEELYRDLQDQTSWRAIDYVLDSNMELATVAKWDTLGNAAIAKTDTFAASGAQALEIRVRAADEGAYVPVNITAENHYRLMVSALSKYNDGVSTATLQIWDAIGDAEVAQVPLYMMTSPSGSEPAWFGTTLMSFTAPAGCDSALIRIIGDDAGLLYVDDVSCVEILTANPNFAEGSAGGVADNWTKNGSWTAAIVSNANYTGGYAQSMQGADGYSNSLSQDHSFTSGKSYLIRCRCRCTTNNDDLVIDCDSSFVYPYKYRATVPTGAPGALRVIAFVVLCDSTGTGTVRIYQSGGSSTHIIDDLSVQEVPSGQVLRGADTLGVYLREAAGVLSWLDLAVASTEWTLAITFRSGWASASSRELHELWHLAWGHSYWIGLSYDFNREGFVGDHYSSGHWDKMYYPSASWSCASVDTSTTITIMKEDAGGGTYNVSMWMEGLQLGDTITNVADGDGNTTQLFFPANFTLQEINFTSPGGGTATYTAAGASVEIGQGGSPLVRIKKR